MRNPLMIIGLVILASCSPQAKLNRLTKNTKIHLQKHPELRDAFDTASFTSTDSTGVSLFIDSTLTLDINETAVENLIEMIRAEPLESTDSMVIEDDPLPRRIVKAITNEVLKNKEFRLDVPISIDAPDTSYTDTLYMNITYSNGQIHINGDVNLNVETQKTTVDITYKEFGTFWVWLKDEKTLFLIAIIIILVFAICTWLWIKIKL